MVLDKIINPKLLRTRPMYAVPTGFLFVLLGFIASMLIFPSALSLVMVAMSSLLILPYVIKIFEFDELDVDIDDTNRDELEKWIRKCLRDGFSPKQIKDNLIRDNLNKPYDLIYDLASVDEKYIKHMRASNVLTRHRKTIEFYIYLFFGMFLSYMVLYAMLSTEVRNFAFDNQIDVIIPGPTGQFAHPALFTSIITNNLKIMLICVLLSLLYGSGAIFILNYNASIAGVLYASSLKALLLGTRTTIFINPLLYIPHTSLEILAYLLAAISGGILSKATVGEFEGSKRILLKDGGILFLLSVLLVLFAGYVEIQVI